MKGKGEEEKQGGSEILDMRAGGNRRETWNRRPGKTREGAREEG